MVQQKAAVPEHGLAELAVVEVVAELLGAAAEVLAPLASPDNTWFNANLIFKYPLLLLLDLHVLAARPLPRDAVRVFAVVVVAAAGALVSAALLPHHVEPLTPLLELLVAGVVGPGLLGEVGEHGGQGLPAHGVAPLLALRIGADGGKLGDGLKQPPVGVAGVAPREQVLVILLRQDELHPFDVVGIVRVSRHHLLHQLGVEGLDGLLDPDKLRVLGLEPLLHLPRLQNAGDGGVLGVGGRGDAGDLRVVVVNVDGIDGGGRPRGRSSVTGHVFGQRSLGVLLADARCGPVADLEAGVEDEIGGAGLQTGLAILTLVVFSTVSRMYVQLVTCT